MRNQQLGCACDPLFLHLDGGVSAVVLTVRCLAGALLILEEKSISSIQAVSGAAQPCSKSFGKASSNLFSSQHSLTQSFTTLFLSPLSQGCCWAGVRRGARLRSGARSSTQVCHHHIVGRRGHPRPYDVCQRAVQPAAWGAHAAGVLHIQRTTQTQDQHSAGAIGWEKGAGN